LALAEQEHLLVQQTVEMETILFLVRLLLLPEAAVKGL
jgi:hypothetical protein